MQVEWTRLPTSDFAVKVTRRSLEAANAQKAETGPLVVLRVTCGVPVRSHVLILRVSCAGDSQTLLASDRFEH
jgi:hypothetical protein